eukprot:s2036_g3.t1
MRCAAKGESAPFHWATGLVKKMRQCLQSRFRWGLPLRPEGGGYASRVAAEIQKNAAPRGGVLWTAETAQRARLVAKAQADVCIAVARAASTGAFEAEMSPKPHAPLGQDVAHVAVAHVAAPKVIRQGSSPQRVLQRAVSAPPAQGVLQFVPAGTPNGTPKVGYRQVRGSSPRLGSPRPQVAQAVHVAQVAQPTPRSPGLPTGRPPNPNAAGRPPANQSPLKRASSPRNVFGMESPGRKAHTPSPSPMQRHRDVAIVKASSTPRLPHRNVREQSPQGTPRWMNSPQARSEELEREKRNREERLKRLEAETREARQRLQQRLQDLEQQQERQLSFRN